MPLLFSRSLLLVLALFAGAATSAPAGARPQGSRRCGDGAYNEGSAPGEYRFTANTPFAFAPRLGELTPFVMAEGSEFRPGPPHPVTGDRYTRDFDEIKRLGGDAATTPSARTSDETQIAMFWFESSPLQWNRIARTVSAGEDLWEKARLFALLDMALTDGYTGSFEAKYHYNYWRPVTAIRAAATDGNAATQADPTWTPLQETPAIPDYDSGHAVQGARRRRCCSGSSAPTTSGSRPAARRCRPAAGAAIRRPSPARTRASRRPPARTGSPGS